MKKKKKRQKKEKDQKKENLRYMREGDWKKKKKKPLKIELQKARDAYSNGGQPALDKQRQLWKWHSKNRSVIQISRN